MIDGQRFIAVIPARGGSKRVRKKNLRQVGGVSLLERAIDGAQKVSELDNIVVSTEDTEIRNEAIAAGIKVVDRPDELADDDVPTEDVLEHVLDEFSIAGKEFDFVVILEPTAPFRTAETIARCMKQIVLKQGDSLLTVKKSYENIGNCDCHGWFRPIRSPSLRIKKNREPFYIESGTMYIVSVPHLRARHSVYSENWLSEVVPDVEAIDIDTELDLIFANSIAQEGKL